MWVGMWLSVAVESASLFSAVTASGCRPDIEVGDEVIATDLETGEQVTKTVDTSTSTMTP